MRVLSQTAEYALRAVVAIAAGGGEPVGATALAETLKTPRNYLSKTLYKLTRAGILDSSRGRRGGFRLARPAEEMPLLDIVNTFDDVGGNLVCLMGRPVCSDHSPCAAHERWKAVGEKASGFFKETMVADLVERLRGRGQPGARPLADVGRNRP
jgi:Rrf2 family protein